MTPPAPLLLSAALMLGVIGLGTGCETLWHFAAGVAFVSAVESVMWLADGIGRLRDALNADAMYLEECE